MSRAMDRKMFVQLIKNTFRDWRLDNASLLAAGLSYYAILALAPLLFLTLIIVGRFYPDEAQSQITLQITRFIGPRIATAVDSIIAEANRPAGGTIAIIVSAVTLFIATSGAFAQLMNALDVIWKVRPSGKRGILGTIIDRLLAFAMLLVIGVLLLSSFLATWVIARANVLLGIDLNRIPLWNIVLSLGLTTLLFAAIFKVLPRVDLGWRHVWIGALVTAALFVVGKELIGVYLSLSNVSSGYGTAGSIIVLLIFVYYSAQILLFGAEFTKHYATRPGRHVEIDAYAVRYRVVTEKDAEPDDGGGQGGPAEAASQEVVAAPARRRSSG